MLENRQFKVSQNIKITAKLALLVLLSLFLIIPLVWMNSLISDRSTLNKNVQTKIAESWALPQTLIGPFLIIPKKEESSAKKDKESPLIILPKTLIYKGDIVPEKRSKGIFTCIVYQANLNIKATFAPLKTYVAIHDTYSLDKTNLVLRIDDLRGISTLQLQCNDKQMHLHPGVPFLEQSLQGVHSSLHGISNEKELNFDIDLQLKGTNSLSFLPLGQESSVDLTSSWASPGFDGHFLPLHREITSTGFTAHWKIPALARNISETFHIQEWEKNIQEKFVSFGVSLINPGDSYQQSERALKYGFLFILYTFLAFFLLEVVKKTPVHLFQYVLSAASLLCFFIMLAAFGEYLTFGMSYLLAAMSIIIQISLYTYKLIQKTSERIGFTAIFAGIYVYLYTVLQLEDYAFLIGAISLFVILSFTMFYTRNVKWFEEKENSSL